MSEIPKCASVGCKLPSTKTLKLTMKLDPAKEPAIAFLRVFTCDEHVMRPDQVDFVLAMNWERIAMGMTSMKIPAPKRGDVTWEWVPREEGEKFWQDYQRETKVEGAPSKTHRTH
jgi:hypothetical protein